MRPKTLELEKGLDAFSTFNKLCVEGKTKNGTGYMRTESQVVD